MRTFVAIDLPAPVIAALERLSAHVPEGRPVPPENLHLTLAFLDDQPDAVLAELCGVLDRLSPQGFDIRLTGLGVFGGKTPRSLHAEAAADPALIALHEAVRGSARRAGIDLPRARFRPHVTIARFGAGLTRDGQRRVAGFIARHGLPGIPPTRVASFSLWRSVLRPGGARHDRLASWPVGGGAAPPPR